VALDEAKARELLEAVLKKLWDALQAPVLGSRLKTSLLSEARKNGSEFDERALGYDSFAAFVARSGVAAVKFRSGTDVLVAPIAHATAVETAVAGTANRVRPDFWTAFIRLPIPGRVRAYDRTEDHVWEGSPDAIGNRVPIDPIPLDKHLHLRRQFAEAEGHDWTPAGDVKPTMAFRDFTQWLTNNPHLRAKWNRFWFNQVAQEIHTWASTNGIPNDKWLAGAEDDLRRRLYEALDEIPLEKLLKLRVPLGWFLASSKR